MSKRVMRGNVGDLSVRTQSSRARKLHEIKKEARKIREQHAAGKLNVEEAAKKLRALHTHSVYRQSPSRFVKAFA